MGYREYRAPAALQSFVECCWELETDGGAVQRVVPDGRSELIVNLGAPFEALVDGVWQRQPRSFLAGQITGPLLLRPAGPAKIRGVRFRPHGAAAVFGPGMNQLADRFTEAGAELKGWGVGMSFGATCTRACATDALTAEAVRLLELSLDVAGVARQVGLSCRQLERRFLREVGMTPKLFGRIQRFQKVFRAIEGERPDWASAAVACRYHDQSHLIRDFREFTGTTPAVLLAGDDLAVAFLQYKRERGR